MANLSFYIISSQLTHCSSKQIDSLIFSFLHKFLVLRMNFSFPLGFLKQEEVFTLVEQGRAQVWSATSKDVDAKFLSGPLVSLTI